MKRRRLSVPAGPAIETEDENESLVHDGDGAELTIGEAFFKPLNIVGVWEEPGTKTKRISVVIVLPSGVNKHDFSLSVPDSGRMLELRVTWPDPLVNLRELHQKWLRPLDASSSLSEPFTMFHPKVLALEDALKKKREHANDIVSSTARIPLPFAVQTHIEAKSNLFFKSTGTKILYVELKAMAESYGVTYDKDDFEEF